VSFLKGSYLGFQYLSLLCHVAIVRGVVIPRVVMVWGNVQGKDALVRCFEEVSGNRATRIPISVVSITVAVVKIPGLILAASVTVVAEAVSVVAEFASVFTIAISIILMRGSSVLIGSSVSIVMVGSVSILDSSGIPDTGDKGPNTHWAHGEHIVITVNM